MSFPSPGGLDGRGHVVAEMPGRSTDGPVMDPLGPSLAGAWGRHVWSWVNLALNVMLVMYNVYLVVHPTNRKWVSSPQL